MATLSKTYYDKWLEQLKPEYKFAKNYVTTLEKHCTQKIEEYKKMEKMEKSESKTQLFKQIKLAVIVKKQMILFCNICENNEKTQFESMDKPFKILEIIQMTIRAAHRRQSRTFPLLNKEQKGLVEAEEKQFKKCFLNKKTFPIRKTIQKNKNQKNNQSAKEKSAKEKMAHSVITSLLSIAENKKTAYI